MRISRQTIPGVLLILAVASGLFAEVPNRSPEQLKRTATHVVTADVVRVYARIEQDGERQVTRYVAELRVKSVEAGDGIPADSPLYVRYFQQRNPPGVTGTSGHRGLPKDGDHVRAYLARNASNGYEDGTDGGFDVVFPNGFEPLEKADRK